MEKCNIGASVVSNIQSCAHVLGTFETMLLSQDTLHE